MITASLRGLTLGSGTPFRVARYPQRLLSTATIRRDDQPRVHAHGVTPGGDWLGENILAFELIVSAGSRADALDRVVELRAAFAPANADEWLVVDLDGREMHFRGRCNGVEIPLDRRYLSGTFPARASFVSTDGLAYGTEQTVMIYLADDTDGSTLPNELPTVIGTVAGLGEESVTNVGNQPAEWTATFDGPLTNPRLAQPGTGRFIRLLTDLDVGESIEVDSEVGAVLVGNGTRNDLLAPGSSFFTLPSGGSSIRFTADAGSGSATIRWRPPDA